MHCTIDRAQVIMHKKVVHQCAYVMQVVQGSTLKRSDAYNTRVLPKRNTLEQSTSHQLQQRT
jgi:hypothetical protein